MSARILNGADLANTLRERIALQVQAIREKHQLVPGLAVVLVGNNPASQVYVRNKISACAKAGFKSVQHNLDEHCTQAELLDLINTLNHDPEIHGILVQLPLPKHLSEHAVIEAIAAHKDVDGFHISNAGLLMTGNPLFKPCTPYGVMKLLEAANIHLEGAEAVVVGSSNIVGKPQAMLLLQAGATVTLCNSKTKDLKAHCKRADVLVVAVGKPNLITADMVKPGAMVIDVGINRLPDGILCGDVDFDAVSKVASCITPVPGGVGPMTITMLLQNTLEGLLRSHGLSLNETPQNPLLEPFDLPPFGQMDAQHIGPAVDGLLVQARHALQAAEQTPAANATYEKTLQPLYDAYERLIRAWGVVSHLNSVMDTEAWRNAYNANQGKITTFATQVGQSAGLYAATCAIAEAAGHSPARQQSLAHSIRGFKLSGVELPAEKQQQFAAIASRLAMLSTTFSENALDATQAFSCLVASKDDLAGLPEYALEAAGHAAQAAGQTGFLFSLQFPSYYPVMQHCQNRSLRETLYRAYSTRASERYAECAGPHLKAKKTSAEASTTNTGDAQAAWDNSATMAEILALRLEKAKLLGYRHYADVSIVPKMAESPEAVEAFLLDLCHKAKPFAQRDLAELREFAKTELGIETLESWDVAFCSERLREKRYSYSELEVREYFQEPNVLDGLFKLTEQLFHVRIKAATTAVWHPDVRYFEVFSAQSSGAETAQPMASFYLDPYAREGKRQGAWMDDCRGRKRVQQHAIDAVQTPVAYLTCNFTPPAEGQNALLSFDEVLTLFHEFGHGLHHMLTQVDELDVSGINGVEWDAVELPSQFMENFAWEWQVVQQLTAHHQTGQPMPRALFDKMLAAKNYHSGLQTLRQIEFALFDLRMHMADPAPNAAGILNILQKVREEVAVLVPPEYNRFAHTFSHIFAGGYAAGYYSYKWAEVLSADAYAAFEETGIVNATTGARFLNEILAVGGSRPAADSFKAFRGRAPTLDALLRHCGMVDAPCT